MGFNQHNVLQDLGEHGVDELPHEEGPGEVRLLKPIQKMLDAGTIERQLGTLGGGNHFIELQEDEQGKFWIMLHSGSRKLGHTVASFYHKRAMMLCERWHSDCVPDLAFLPFGEKDTRDYYKCLQYCLAYAQANREHMMRMVQDIVEDNLGRVPQYVEEINIHHNFAAQENHMGKNVWVHRKGATKADEGQLGIIPGSMGTKSYIVRGKGDVQSFRSCSHGAGRRMGRKEFCRTHDLEAVNESIKDVVFAGWSVDRKGKVDFSEAPEAYKDIDTVMAAQEDLVDIVHTLKPLAVAKG
jgi:tRNA-splicing ligase RtcB